MLKRKKREEKERKIPITLEPSVICATLPMPVCIELGKAVRKQ